MMRCGGSRAVRVAGLLVALAVSLVTLVEFGRAQDRTVILVDRSGSMGNPGVGGASGLEDAQGACKLLVGLLPYSHVVGIASFGSGFSVDLTPVSVSGTLQRDQVWQALDGLVASGGSTLGDGLEAARAELAALGPTSGEQSIVLITDGADVGSANDPLLDVLPRLQADGVRCHSIAWEAGADVPMLEELAEQTGGTFGEAFDQRSRMVSLEDLATFVAPGVRIDRWDLDLDQGALQTREEIVDEGIGPVSFTTVASRSGDEISFELITPSSDLIDEARAALDPNVEYIEFGAARAYRIEQAASGTWTVRMRGISIPGGSSWVRLDVTRGSAAMPLAASRSASTYALVEPAVLSARIDDGGNAVLGLEVEAFVRGPGGGASRLRLRDDGSPLSGDVLAGDGTYSGRFFRWEGAGSYRALILAASPMALLPGGTQLGPIQRAAEVVFEATGTEPEEGRFMRIDSLSARAEEERNKRNHVRLDASFDFERRDGDPDLDDLTVVVGGVSETIPAGTMERRGDRFRLRADTMKVDLDLHQGGSSLGRLRFYRSDLEVATIGNLEVIPVEIHLGAVDLSASVLPRLRSEGTRALWRRGVDVRQDQEWILESLDLRNPGEGRDRLSLSMTLANILVDPTLDDLILSIEGWGIVFTAGRWSNRGNLYSYELASGRTRVSAELDLGQGTLEVGALGIDLGAMPAPLRLGIAIGSFSRQMVIEGGQSRARIRYGR